ncbi:MAG: hypothetical protein ACRDQU_09265 [Pseudonocardiaceae bacterium]
MTNPRTGWDAGVRESISHHGRRPKQNNPSTDIPHQLRCRRVASGRCEPLRDGRRDPWIDQVSDDWTDRELTAWQAATEHLRNAGLYGKWQVPDSVRVAWQRRHCRAGRWSR